MAFGATSFQSAFAPNRNNPFKSVTLSINSLQVAIAPKSNHNDNTQDYYWNCSNCNTNNHPTRNRLPCRNCGVMDSDRLRIKANGFYQFGIIESPKTSLLPKDPPFFIRYDSFLLFKLV